MNSAEFPQHLEATFIKQKNQQKLLQITKFTKRYFVVQM